MCIRDRYVCDYVAYAYVCVRVWLRYVCAVSYTHLDVYKRQHRRTRTQTHTHTHTFDLNHVHVGPIKQITDLNML